MSKSTKHANILLSTFLHFKGIGKKTEMNLWNKGIFSWEDFETYIGGKQLSLFNDYPNNPIIKSIKSSQKAFKQENADYFATHLPKQEFYRIVLSFFSKTIFLDIETTGLSKYYDYITMVGWSMCGRYYYILKGDNEDLLRKHLKKAKCIITFNGSIFDIPFLKKEYDNLTFPKTHVDLRFFSRRVGLKGGQKKIENMVGIKRPVDIEKIDGKAATILWYKFRNGDIESLRSLIKYNYQDVIGMEILFDEIVKRLETSNSINFLKKPIFRFRKNKKIPKFNLTVPKEELINKLNILNKTSESLTINRLTNKKFNLKVVGIDLTGSEKRATGLCLIDGDHAYTKLINSDNEIIEYTMKQKPDLVSIDSPLSLPKGRISVHDDDPGRNKYGIMRQCERILKRRGVNIYPSLIPSMQKLTKRGISFAKKFRGLGIPVIESFPGAAQDIMKIPRKRSDVIMLKKGLIKFCIKGEYQNKKVSHDELDAITSAIVGFFFWYGKFEALGNIDEEYLIIPELNSNTSKWENKSIVGFSGPMATGKTTAGKFLETDNFYYTRFSIILEKMLKNIGEEVTRENLQNLGLKIEKEDQRILCNELYKELPLEGNIVIDGLRHPEDHAFFIEFFGPNFKHIFIDSPLHFRRQRYINMGKSEKEFDKAIHHEVESNVSKLSELAHLIVFNDKSLDDFKTTIKNTIKKY